MHYVMHSCPEARRNAKRSVALAQERTKQSLLMSWRVQQERRIS